MNYNILSNSQDQEWVFPETDVVITDTILGRGAFGEVRIAHWRGISVAAKRLHVLSTDKEQQEEGMQAVVVAENLRKEIDVLSKLRHPNLVLFLGICYDVGHGYPTTILTELMPGSLYDILEVHKMKLSLADILDISLDVIAGLEYLHSHKPQVVHRDISSKNILIGGNRAKITDLGQSKILGQSVVSRQTGMPGAMAYSAPEVLTGKYTSKIDIFSFGVLLVQMCCQEYPRIDRREDQLQKACESHTALDQVLRRTLSFQPSDRPTAQMISEQLKVLKANDRYYPPIRKVSPQSDVGILARRWLHAEIEERCRSTKIALEQTSRRLTAEEQRWRDEADRADKTERKLREVESLYNNTKQNIDALQGSVDHAVKAKKDLEVEIQRNQQEISLLISNERTLEDRIKSLEDQITQKSIENNMLKLRDEEMCRQVEAAEQTVRAAKEAEANALRKEKELRMQLDMQVDESRELEARLEQALIRWKQEKEHVCKETARCTRLRNQCAELIEKNNRLSAELDRLNTRLGLYDTLPMPEEIKQRLKDMESDHRRDALLISELTDKKEQLERELHATSEKSASLDRIIAEKVIELSDSKNEIGAKNQEISQLMSRIAGLEGDLRLCQEACERHISEKNALTEHEQMLSAQLKEFEVTLANRGNQKVVLEILRQKLKGIPRSSFDANTLQNNIGGSSSHESSAKVEDGTPLGSESSIGRLGSEDSVKPTSAIENRVGTCNV